MTSLVHLDQLKEKVEKETNQLITFMPGILVAIKKKLDFLRCHSSKQV